LPQPTVDIHDIENRLWAPADELRANSGLKESEYSVPMLGLIFLKCADSRFSTLESELPDQNTGRRRIGKEDYQARGVMYLPPAARFAHLLSLPEGASLGQAVNDAMKAIEDENEELRGVLPLTYNALTNAMLATVIRNVNAILGYIDGDGFGKVYEYFLGKFAMAEGLTDEQLAMYDLLTRPGPDLTETERKAIKRVAEDLLLALKRDKLVLEWHQNQQARAAVKVEIETELDHGLPTAYDASLFQQKADAVFAHIFDSYWDDGRSVYSAVA
jgi:hypothetical protein